MTCWSPVGAVTVATTSKVLSSGMLDPRSMAAEAMYVSLARAPIVMSAALFDPCDCVNVVITYSSAFLPLHAATQALLHVTRAAGQAQTWSPYQAQKVSPLPSIGSESQRSKALISLCLQTIL